MLAREVSLAACSLNDPTDKLLQFYEYATKNLWKFCGRSAKPRHIGLDMDFHTASVSQGEMAENVEAFASFKTTSVS